MNWLKKVANYVAGAHFPGPFLVVWKALSYSSDDHFQYSNVVCYQELSIHQSITNSCMILIFSILDVAELVRGKEFPPEGDNSESLFARHSLVQVFKAGTQVAG